MKKLIRIIFFMSILFLCTNCYRDENVEHGMLEMTIIDSKMDFTTAEINWHVQSNATISQVFFEYSNNKDFKNPQRIPMSGIPSMGTPYHTELQTLASGTTYYSRCYAYNSVSSSVSNVYTFRTLGSENVELLLNISSIMSSYYSTKLCWYIETNTTFDDIILECSSDSLFANPQHIEISGISSVNNPYLTTINQLNPDEKYYIRCLAHNQLGTFVSSVKSFRTLSIGQPEIHLTDVQILNSSSCLVSYVINSTGGCELYAHACIYTRSPEAQVEWYKVGNDYAVHVPNFSYGCVGYGPVYGDTVLHKTYNITIEHLLPDSTYYICQTILNKCGYYASSNIISITMPKQSAMTAGIPIDLGLSVKWSDRNIDAEQPNHYGNKFAWGEVDESNNTDMGDWSNYTHCSEGKYYKQIKYNQRLGLGVVDDLITLELIDDAANFKWGGSWRIPTIDEFNELLSNCTCTLSHFKNTNGYWLKSNITGDSIFLPRPPYMPYAYWTSSASSLITGCCYPSAYYLSLNGVAITTSGIGKARCESLYIRPVCP